MGGTAREDRSEVSSRAAKTPVRSGSRASGPCDAGVGVRVLCVDDHAVLVEGLKAHFAIDGRIGVVGWLASAEHLIDEVERLHPPPDVVLLDIEMPGPDAFETADRLHRQFPRIRAVFLSAHIRDGYIAAAYKCGAWGYFAKSDEPDDIAAGVMAVAQNSAGTFVMGPKVQRHCRPVSVQGVRPAPEGGTVDARSEPGTPLRSLTGREIEVLRLIGRGLSRNQIAMQLCRSAKTVDGHQERMMKKLAITTRSELMRFAIREGLAEA